METQYLKREMGKRGLWQVELAEMMGVSEACVSRWLGGSRRIPAEQVQAALEEWDHSPEAQYDHRTRRARRIMWIARRYLRDA